MALKEYFVTKKAGKMLGSIRNPGVGEGVVMSETQAEHLLRTFQISAEKPRKAKKPTPKSGSEKIGK